MNNVNLLGRLTRDPEQRQAGETQITTFSLAVDRPFSKNKEADFLRIVVFGKQAENCAKYLNKGKRAAVQGRIQTGSYKNKDGVTVYTTDIIADRVEFLDWGEQQDANGEKDATNLPNGFESLSDEDDEEIPF